MHHMPSDPFASGNGEPALQLTKWQRERYRILERRHGNIAVDWTGTREARAVASDPNLVVLTATEGTVGVRIWLIDREGDVLIDGGAEVPE